MAVNVKYISSIKYEWYLMFVVGYGSTKTRQFLIIIQFEVMIETGLGPMQSEIKIDIFTIIIGIDYIED